MTTFIKRAFGRLRAAADGVRDWRVRTLVPVLAVNVLVFAGLFALMYHFGVKNLVTTKQLTARILLDGVEMTFSNQMLAHRAEVLEVEVANIAQTSGLVGIAIYNAVGELVVHAGAHPTDVELMQGQKLLFETGPATQWFVSDDRSRLVLGRYLGNAPQCQGCHSNAFSRLGAIQLAVDLEQPIAQMERSMSAAVGEQADAHDLQSLAARINRTLEVIDNQRTREAEMSRQMVRAEQLAALGELAAGLTHEIKNPLAGVIAALELLRSDAEPGSEQSDLYEQMLGELRRVTDTLTSLLRLAKPQPPHRSEVDLARVAREVTTLFGARTRRQGVELGLELAGPLPILKLDSGLMVQLLVNLLTNALQATSRGGRITVGLRAFPLNDGVMLCVSDTGSGIAPEQLERIFDPFFTTKDEGTGLGLAICRQIAEQHGGTIAVESEPGQGTRVTILLPRVEKTSLEEAHVAAVAG